MHLSEHLPLVRCVDPTEAHFVHQHVFLGEQHTGTNAWPLHPAMLCGTQLLATARPPLRGRRGTKVLVTCTVLRSTEVCGSGGTVKIARAPSVLANR